MVEHSQAETQTYWRSVRWSLSVRRQGGARKHFSQKLPFARIGSDPVCEIRLPAELSPPFAYLLCALVDRVEVVPLATLPDARSGPLSPGEELTIGGFSISVEIENSPASPTDADRRSPALEISHKVQKRLTRLKHPITLVGSDQPCQMILRGIGLSPCHGAFISDAGRVWLLTFALPRSSPDLLRRLDFLSLLPLESLTLRLVGESEVDTVTIQPSPAQVKAQVRLPSKKGGEVPAAPLAADPDDFASHVTRRMVRIGWKKAFLPRLKWVLVIAVVTMAATVVLLKIYNRVRPELEAMGWG